MVLEGMLKLAKVDGTKNPDALTKSVPAPTLEKHPEYLLHGSSGIASMLSPKAFQRPRWKNIASTFLVRGPRFRPTWPSWVLAGWRQLPDQGTSWEFRDCIPSRGRG
eukprot:247512-Rhodomonas_salina.1